jgi:hypothetical protein
VSYVKTHPFEQDGGVEEAVLEAWVSSITDTTCLLMSSY